MIVADQAAALAPQSVNTERGRDHATKEHGLHRRYMSDLLDEHICQKECRGRKEHRPDAGERNDDEELKL